MTENEIGKAIVSMIMPGVTIGEGAIVAANSVVTKDVGVRAYETQSRVFLMGTPVLT